MKKRFLLLVMALFVGSAMFAQKPNGLVTPDQKHRTSSYEERFEQISLRAEPHIPNAQPLPQPSSVAKTSGINAVAPIQMGGASNVFSILRPEQNQVYADNDLALVAFIHRHDVNVWGGGGAESGKLRFDLSVDTGNTFVPDIDVLNATYTRPARYPNLTGFNPNNETNPFNTFLAYSAPTLNGSPDWDGHVTGVANVSLSPPATATETYSLLSSQSYLQGGMTEGLPNEFWTVENQYDGAGFPGNIYVNKGTFANGDITWARKDTVSPNHNLSFDGSPRLVGPNISFSPDGQTAWLAWLGDLQGGQDSVYSPVFMKSTDGGETWGSPIEVDLNSDPAVAAYLTSFWVDVDSITGDTTPVSSGRATCAFEFDMTVDINGNPHLVAVIGSGSTVAAPAPGYSIFSGIEKFIADVWSPDGGATWEVKFIAPILAFRGDFGSTNTIGMDNMPQASRTPNGDHVFYSWADSDTSVFSGSGNGIGFGVSDQLAPNLRISGCRISDGASMCYKRITDGDFLWEGRALFPTMAPEVIVKNGMVHLPIVMVEMVNNDALQSCIFWYFGNDAVVDPANDFGVLNIPADLEWDVPCTALVDIDRPIAGNQILLGQSYPNPTNSEAFIEFEMPVAAQVTMDLTNMYGQQVAIIANDEFGAGAHRVSVDTRNLSAGIYFYNLRANGEVISKKMMVTK